MKTLACSHSYAIKNQPDSLSLFVLGGRGGTHFASSLFAAGNGSNLFCASKTLLANAIV